MSSRCARPYVPAAAALRFGVVDQTKLVTATSELARNTLIYGGGGVAHISEVNSALGKRRDCKAWSVRARGQGSWHYANRSSRHSRDGYSRAAMAWA